MSSVPLELPSTTYDLIQRHCSVGDGLAEEDRFKEAVDEYSKAWELIPEPKTDWNASTWVLAAIADACFLGGFTEQATEALEYAMKCPGALGNPFLHMRLGQVLYDAGELDAAANELMRAYMGGGAEIFRAEDSRYLQFLGTRADL